MDTDDLKIYCKNTGEYIDVVGGESLQQVYEVIKNRLNMGRAICARVNNKTEHLSYKVYAPRMVEYVDTMSPDGYNVYLRSLCMILYKAIHDLYPTKRLCIEHSISGGYFFIFKHETTPIPQDMVDAIKVRMHEIVDANIKFVRRERLTSDVIEMFDQQGLPDKVRLLKSSKDIYTVYYRLDDIIDSYSGPLAPSTGHITVFDLVPYKGGVILLAPNQRDPSKPNEFVPQEKMFKAFTDHIDFNCVIGVSDIGELNNTIRRRETSMLINVAEALHNKMMAHIAADIAERHHNGGARVVLIAGPSSSGKTTTSKRLAIQLMTNYITPKVIALDNYFVNRDRTPRDETGDFDYESLYALDLEQFNKDLSDLIAGREVNLPSYNFTTGQREYKGNKMHLDENDILLMEGIHGLNPELTRPIPDEQKFRLYVSALTTLMIDDHNWIPASDNRLLRRIVRDYKYRGATAQATIARWPSVRRGEEKWIFPFQENADATFNSSLIFELAVMKNYAEPILNQVPRSAPEYNEAHRLLRLLNYFEPLHERDVPSVSLLREFLGGSSFHY